MCFVRTWGMYNRQKIKFKHQKRGSLEQLKNKKLRGFSQSMDWKSLLTETLVKKRIQFILGTAHLAQGGTKKWNLPSGSLNIAIENGSFIVVLPIKDCYFP